MYTTLAMKQIKRKVIDILQKHSIKWSKLNVWETSDGFLVEIESPNIDNDLQGIELLRKLERELNDPTISLSILPSD